MLSASGRRTGLLDSPLLQATHSHHATARAAAPSLAGDAQAASENRRKRAPQKRDCPKEHRVRAHSPVNRALVDGAQMRVGGEAIAAHQATQGHRSSERHPSKKHARLQRRRAGCCKVSKPKGLHRMVEGKDEQRLISIPCAQVLKASRHRQPPMRAHQTAPGDDLNRHCGSLGVAATTEGGGPAHT